MAWTLAPLVREGLHRSSQNPTSPTPSKAADSFVCQDRKADRLTWRKGSQRPRKRIISVIEPEIQCCCLKKKHVRNSNSCATGANQSFPDEMMAVSGAPFLSTESTLLCVYTYILSLSLDTMSHPSLLYLRFYLHSFTSNCFHSTILDLTISKYFLSLSFPLILFHFLFSNKTIFLHRFK
jgi:hypothetical protein